MLPTSSQFIQALLTILFVLQLILSGASSSEARNLTTVLREGFQLRPSDPRQIATLFATVNPTRRFVDVSDAGEALAPVLSAAITNAVTQQSPLASAAPAFTYRYNPALSAYERSTDITGPLFSERAMTIGKGQFNFGIGYSYVGLDEVNGTSLRNLRTPALLEFFCPDGPKLVDCFIPTPQGTIAVTQLGLTSVRTQLHIQTHLIVPTVRYGLTDNWDIGLSLPIVNTFLRVRNDLIPVAEADVFSIVGSNAQGEQVSRFVDANGQLVDPTLAKFYKTSRPRQVLTKVARSSTGIGDITLRTKYRLWGEDLGGASAGLELRLPSGDEDNFRGTGETHVSPFLYLSHVLWDRIEPHLNLGLDFNTKDVDRSAFLYSVGIVARLWAGLGAGFDVIGRSEFGRFSPREGSAIFGDELERPVKTCTKQNPCGFGKLSTFRFPVRITRNDIIDLSFSLRYSLGMSGSVFFGAIVPLNDDGFRADFIPSGGVEFTF